MTDSLKAAAKAGDIKALEALMNKSFEPKGITVRVTNSGPLLKVLLRAKELPDPKTAALVKQGLQSIQPTGFEAASIMARAIGKKTAWTDEWSLKDFTTELSSTPHKTPESPKQVKYSDNSKGSKTTLLLVLLGLTGVVGWLLFQRAQPSPEAVSMRNAAEEIHQAIEETDRQIQEDSVSSAVAETDSTSLVSDPFGDAVRNATQAANLAQTAQAPEEWANVAKSWSEAIRFMQEVPVSSESYELAQNKANEYQANFSYAQQQEVRNLPQSSASSSSNSTSSSISDRATQIKAGMTYLQVIKVLDRVPDTVVNDQIRRSLGEPTQGNNLVTFEWRNDNYNCHPISVQFDPSSMTTTGWSEGKTCPGQSIFNEPLGLSCFTETDLCEVR